jgi:hypothetical protein
VHDRCAVRLIPKVIDGMQCLTSIIGRITLWKEASNSDRTVTILMLPPAWRHSLFLIAKRLLMNETMPSERYVVTPTPADELWCSHYCYSLQVVLTLVLESAHDPEVRGLDTL